MRSTSLDTCCTRSEMAHPCCGPTASVLRIRRSSVPCGRSSRSSLKLFPLHFYKTQIHHSYVEVQGEIRGQIARGPILAFWVKDGLIASFRNPFPRVQLLRRSKTRCSYSWERHYLRDQADLQCAFAIAGQSKGTLCFVECDLRGEQWLRIEFAALEHCDRCAVFLEKAERAE